MNKENIFSRVGIPSKKAKPNYFTGQVAAKDISAVIKPKNEKIYHVTFKNGTKTKLHFHDGGQTLIVTKGTGIYQYIENLVKIILISKLKKPNHLL